MIALQSRSYNLYTGVKSKVFHQKKSRTSDLHSVGLTKPKTGEETE